MTDHTTRHPVPQGPTKAHDIAEAHRARTSAADELCRTAFEACGESAGLALVAVGGYGRGELAPHSDLDLVLVHTPEAAATAERVAAELWYPLWDSGHQLDHSVRSVPQVLDQAAADLKVALGLLDMRHVAGDSGLTLQVRTEVLAAWRRGARSRMPELAELTRRRHDVVGEIAHAAVPDLKEGDGGLRDATTLKALEATWLVELPHAELERARQDLLRIREALHTETGRATDRIAPELWGPVADRLGLPSPLAAQVFVRTTGRRVAHLTRLGWRRMEAHLARPAHGVGARRPAITPVAPGVALSAGEVVLAPGARPAQDPLLLLRVAAEAAERDLAPNPATIARLVREQPALPLPWPAGARDLWVRLLAAGRGLFTVWETLDETGALVGLFPEWETIRTLPHASTVHRWTVDRHVVETCMAASRMIREVARPDLLVVAALLHDIGKGQPGDHAVEGESIARGLAVRWGFGPHDVNVIAMLVRHHLLLGELTTTRDPDDPATAEAVIAALRSAGRGGGPERPQEWLDLLAALTAADAIAVSAQAWTPWRARLTQHLVGRVRERLAGQPVSPPEAGTLPVTADDGGVTLALEQVGEAPDVLWRVTVAAPDRVGLAGDVAALFAFVRAPVRSARLWTVPGTAGPVGLSEWWIDGVEVDQAVLRSRFAAIVEGRTVPTSRLSAGQPGDVPARVRVLPDSGSQASILEVRATDRPGLVHRVLRTVAACGVNVVSAHVSSHGPAAVDVFYLTTDSGQALAPATAARVAGEVTEALTVPAGENPLP